ncbi:hypothetical protein OR1_00991 [Geobacter sp. OR-1]|uniref:hypothetical protein n=1 Tax=Geobacter sp. OR-1 TaxID=1266765 RepID=UPI0005441075|nr:hypothetical protein [Geobacter sp. OR-1]GAM08718.1 hypothetical protein OR1_00991 [Geobacter sp. OR-1]
MSSEAVAIATLDDHKKAFNEVAFLLDIFTTTIDNIMGGATAPVGRIAGREMARKLPVYLQNPSLEETITLLAARMKSGFDFSLEKPEQGEELLFKRCVLRDACALRGMPMGGATCRLFHSYLDGIMNELVSRPVKSEIVSCGAECRTRIKTQ